MAPHSFLWHYLWVAPHLLQIAVAVVIIRRKLHREFPLFLGYTVYQIIANVVLFALDHSPSVSPDTYHVAINIDAVLSIALRFAVIYEIFVVVLRPYEALKRLASLVVQFVLVALLGLSLFVATYGPVAAYTSRHISLYIAMDRAASIVQCGLLLVVFVFASYLALSSRSFVFGIAAGLGFYLAVQLALLAISAYVYVPHGNIINMAAYHVSVIGWLFYAWAPQPARLAVKNIPQHQLESWNIELERLLQR
jgi:hypothetical protein